VIGVRRISGEGEDAKFPVFVADNSAVPSLSVGE